MNKYVGQNLMVSLFSSTKKKTHTDDHVSMICYCFVFFKFTIKKRCIIQ